jgi:flagellar motor switch protein FliM
MASPLDPQELEALMAAIAEGRVGPESSGGAKDAESSVVQYDLTSQDRIIRGQMPTLDSINERIASTFCKAIGGRMRLELRVVSSPAVLMKFSEVTGTVADQTITGVLSLGAGHGLALVVIEGALTRGLLSAALGDRSAASTANANGDGRNELTIVEKLVLKHVLGIFADTMAAAWEDVLAFKPEVLRFESDPRMAIISTPSDVAILCSFEVTGVLDGKLVLAIPYAAVEPAKKLLTSPPRLGGQRDARFSQALSREIEAVEVELLVEIGHRTLHVADLVELKVGDVITLNTSEGSPLPVLVQGRHKMTAAPRVVGGGMAVEILKSIVASNVQSRNAKAAAHAFQPAAHSST